MVSICIKSSNYANYILRKTSVYYLWHILKIPGTDFLHLIKGRNSLTYFIVLLFSFVVILFFFFLLFFFCAYRLFNWLWLFASNISLSTFPCSFPAKFGERLRQWNQWPLQETPCLPVSGNIFFFLLLTNIWKLLDIIKWYAVVYKYPAL